MARHSRLTPRTQAQIVEALRTGLTEEAAARAIGIGISTYYRWKRRGELAEKHWPNLTTEQRRVELPYREFREAVMRAWDEAHLLFVGSIRTAALPHDVTETTSDVVERRNDKGELVIVEQRTTSKTRREHDWRAAQAIMRARGEKGWNDKAQIEISGEGGGPVSFKLEPEEIDLLSEAMSRVQGASSPPPDEEPAE
jgi:hypothetical protein